MTRSGMAGGRHVGRRRKRSVDCQVIKIGTVCEACARHILRTGHVLSSFPSGADPAPTVLPLGSFLSGSNSPCSSFLITVPPPALCTHTHPFHSSRPYTLRLLQTLSHLGAQTGGTPASSRGLSLSAARTVLACSCDDLSHPQTDATRRLATVQPDCRCLGSSCQLLQPVVSHHFELGPWAPSPPLPSLPAKTKPSPFVIPTVATPTTRLPYPPRPSPFVNVRLDLLGRPLPSPVSTIAAVAHGRIVHLCPGRSAVPPLSHKHPPETRDLAWGKSL